MTLFNRMRAIAWVLPVSFFACSAPDGEQGREPEEALSPAPLPGCLTLEIDSLQASVLREFVVPREVRIGHSPSPSDTLIYYRALGSRDSWGSGMGSGRFQPPDSLILTWSNGYIRVGYRLQVRGLRMEGGVFYHPDDDESSLTGTASGAWTPC